MNISSFQRVAINTISNCFGDESKCILVTTSNKNIDIIDVVYELAKSISAIDKKVKVLDITDVNDCGKLIEKKQIDAVFETNKLVKSEDKNDFLSDTKVKDIIKSFSKDNDYLIVACDYMQESQSGMFFATHSNGIILVEKKKSSRKDEIDDTMLALNSLNAKPIGFILL